MMKKDNRNTNIFVISFHCIAEILIMLVAL